LINSKFHIYTGNGKGKTTSAVGLCVRAAGRNKKIYFIQFLKKKTTGEEKILKSIDNIIFKKFGFKEYIINKQINKKHIEETKKGIKYINILLNSSENIDLLILDEFNLIIYYNLLTLKEVNEIIYKCKQKDIELIFTGRNANKKIIQLADLVTELKEIKHYFSDTKARCGIEYWEGNYYEHAN